VEPINARIPAEAARAFAGILRWPVMAGHRYRPRAGCTCEVVGCPTPGAHPLAGASPTLSYEKVAAELENAPGAALIAPTMMFDAISVPHAVGMAAMVNLERIAAVPCFIDGPRVVLLVLPSTGRYAVPPGGPDPSDSDKPWDIEVRSGPGRWVALPPSHGMRWDTTPWFGQTETAVPLLSGNTLGIQLAQAFKTYRGRVAS